MDQQAMSLPHICPECGALLNRDTTCQTFFDTCLVLEFSDPAFGEVHMLTVACFMIQHLRYSDEALVWIERQLHFHLDEGLSPEKIRLQAAKEADQNNRKWKVTRQPDATPLPKIAWTMTIADIATHFQDPLSYQQAVRHWARLTLQEMKPLLPLSKNQSDNKRPAL